MVYFQVATPNNESFIPQNSPWIVHYKRFQTLEEAQFYAVKFKKFQIIKRDRLIT